MNNHQAGYDVRTDFSISCRDMSLFAQAAFLVLASYTDNRCADKVSAGIVPSRLYATVAVPNIGLGSFRTGWREISDTFAERTGGCAWLCRNGIMNN
jgi:hypothetical protein